MKAFSVAITSGMKAERKRQRTFRRNTALATERGKKGAPCLQEENVWTCERKIF